MKENRDREKLLQRKDEMLLIEDFDLEQSQSQGILTFN